MAVQADFYFNNLSETGNVNIDRNGSICKTIKPTESGEALGFTIGETLIITPPTGVNENSFSLHSKIDLDIICSYTGNYWEIKIRPNNLPQETPTTVNVTIGDN